MLKRCIIRFTAFAVLAFAVTAGAEPERHCLWRVTDGTNHVYLQGSVHLLRKEHYPLPGPIEQAYTEADVLVLESDLGVAEDPVQQMKLLTRGMLEGDATLKETLSPETWALAEEKVKALGLSMALFNAFKPWYFAMSITVFKLQNMGFSSLDGLDWHFYRRAVADEKPVVGLETLAFQLDLFDEIAGGDQEALVRQTLEDFDLLETEMEALLRDWSTGNADRLERTLLKNLKDYPGVYKRLVTDRNRNWVPRIADFLEEGRVHMIIVGAGHLGGEQGLLKLLAQKGYRLEQR